MFPVALVNLLITGLAGGAHYQIRCRPSIRSCFFIFAVIAVLSAISLVVQTHPISSALSLIGVMGSLAVLYLLLGAEFIAAAQIDRLCRRDHGAVRLRHHAAERRRGT